MSSERHRFFALTALRRSWWALAAVGAAVAVLGCVWRFDPREFSVPLCSFHALTGLYCPGCGALRAIHQLLHGNLYAAFRLNPLMVVSLPFLAFPLAAAVVQLARRRPLPRVLTSATWVWIVLAIIVLYGILRNIPQYPFNLLAPS